VRDEAHRAAVFRRTLVRADQCAEARRIEELELREVDDDLVVRAIRRFEESGAQGRRRRDVERSAEAEELDLIVAHGRDVDGECFLRHTQPPYSRHSAIVPSAKITNAQPSVSRQRSAGPSIRKR
jgi:hypothetical protein